MQLLTAESRTNESRVPEHWMFAEGRDWAFNTPQIFGLQYKYLYILYIPCERWSVQEVSGIAKYPS